MSTGYHINKPNGLYFVDLQVVEWIDVFMRQAYKDILIESLAYCQKHKGLTPVPVITGVRSHRLTSKTPPNPLFFLKKAP